MRETEKDPHTHTHTQNIQTRTQALGLSLGPRPQLPSEECCVGGGILLVGVGFLPFHKLVPHLFLSAQPCPPFEASLFLFASLANRSPSSLSPLPFQSPANLTMTPTTSQAPDDTSNQSQHKTATTLEASKNSTDGGIKASAYDTQETTSAAPPTPPASEPQNESSTTPNNHATSGKMLIQGSMVH